MLLVCFKRKQSVIYEKLLNTPDNFKAGKVKHFIDNWKAISSDKTVLETLCGYELSFHTVPPTRNKCNNPSFNEQEIESINLEIQNVLSKGIIEETSTSKYQFVTHIFTRPKKDGTRRVILNLKSLYEFVGNYHFKMNSLNTAVNLMKEKCFFGSIDLKDAIPVSQ